MSQALIGLGSNLGDRESHLRSALEELKRIPETALVRVSSIYDSPAAGDPGDPDFLNAVAVLETSVPPRRLLWHLLLIESRLGRERRRWFSPRPIDLDLLFYDRRIIDEADLVIPHPRIAGRTFVLAPLAEVAPDFIHPAIGRPVADLLADAGDPGAVRRRADIREKSR